MHYAGGKSRIGKHIATILKSYRQPDQVYWEPFCGALSVIRHMDGQRRASDSNKALITLFNAIQNGWQFPIKMTREQYKSVKDKMDLDDPMTAIAGVVYSYGGSWFSGYVEDDVRDRVQFTTLSKKMTDCKSVDFFHSDYLNQHPINCLIYADPPYAESSNSYHENVFDSAKFWDVMRKWSKDNTVIISEYTAPVDFKCIWSKEIRQQLYHGDRSTRTEKLFTMNEPPKDEWFIWA